MKPKTRKEALLTNIAGESHNITPITDREKILANMAGGSYDVTPRNREDYLLNEIAKSGMSGGLGEDVDVIGGEK